MNAADAYGRAGWVQAQLLYSTYSLQLHDMPPAQVNLDALLKEDYAKFVPAHSSMVTRCTLPSPT